MGKCQMMEENVDISAKSNEELMNLYSQILDELNERKVVRTHNSPVGDYAEWLVCNRLGYRIENNSNKGYDAVDVESNQRIQIKSRWVRGPLNKIVLSPIRERNLLGFDELVVLLFDENFGIRHVFRMPPIVVAEYGKWRPHINGYLLRMSKGLLDDERVREITNQFID